MSKERQTISFKTATLGATQARNSKAESTSCHAEADVVEDAEIPTGTKYFMQCDMNQTNLNNKAINGYDTDTLLEPTLLDTTHLTYSTKAIVLSPANEYCSAKVPSL